MDDTVPTNEFYQAFGRLEGKVDQLLEQNSQFLEEKAKLEERVRNVERSLWKLSGAAIVISTLIGLVPRFWHG